MQNQVNLSIQTQRYYQTGRTTQVRQRTDTHPSYRDIHNLHKKKEIGGIEDLREVSMIRQGVNIKCLVCYLNARLEDHEKLTPERIAELSKNADEDENIPNHEDWFDGLKPVAPIEIKKILPYWLST